MSTPTQKHIFKAFYGIGPLVALDQITKFLVHHFLEASSFIPVTPFFNLVFVQNKGISFGLFPAGSPLEIFFLSMIATTILIFLGVWYSRTVDSSYTALSLILIMAGAIGNIIDRIRLGAVIDFLDFHVNNWHFPAFNVADSTITIGAVLIVLTQWIESPTLSSLRKDKK